MKFHLTATSTTKHNAGLVSAGPGKLATDDVTRPRSGLRGATFIIGGRRAVYIHYGPDAGCGLGWALKAYFVHRRLAVLWRTTTQPDDDTNGTFTSGIPN